MSIRSACLPRTAFTQCGRSYLLSPFPLKIRRTSLCSLATLVERTSDVIWSFVILQIIFLLSYSIWMPMLSFSLATLRSLGILFLTGTWNAMGFLFVCVLAFCFLIGCTNSNNSNQFNSNSKKTFKWALNIQDEQLLVYISSM